MNILQEIIARKKIEIESAKINVTEAFLLQGQFYNRPAISLKQLLAAETTSGIIAEFKRRSPSKGIINNHASVAEVCKDYTTHGAAGLSVLTDKYFFGAEPDDLSLARVNSVPVLRKDFIIDPYQVTETKAMGADVILLIAACISAKQVMELSACAKKSGLEVLLEIHNKSEIDHICADVDMVGINNRNLKTFEVDINHSIALSKYIPGNKIKIAESGIDAIETIRTFKDQGYKGFLMGELFMKELNPGLAFATFVSQLNDK